MSTPPKDHLRTEWDARWLLRERRNSILAAESDEHALAYTESNIGMRLYGELPIRWAFIINGGALLVFPTFISALGIEIIDSARIAFICFAAGILCAALGCYFAWQNFYQSKMSTVNEFYKMKLESWPQAAEGLSPELKEWAEENAKVYQNNLIKIEKRLTWAFRLGQWLPILSYILFLIGAISLSWNEEILSLAQAGGSNGDQ